MKALLIGEPMGLFMAEDAGPLSEARRFTASVAGAEYNVAVGLARLGHTPVYCTRLGKDPLAQRILNSMSANGIDTVLVSVSEAQQTGFMLKGSTQQGDPEIAYYRQNSAASRLSPQDVDRLDLCGIGWLHVTGIFPAISESAMSATLRLLDRAAALDIPISFDPNLRPQLWPDEAAMIKSLNRLAAYAQVILPGVGEGRLLTGCPGEREIAQYYHGLGAASVVVKLGDAGAYYSEKSGGDGSRSCGYAPGIPVEKLIDTVGAGDGFAVGVISALMEGLPLSEAARRGNAIGAIQVSHKSDNEGLPTRAQLEAVLTAGKVAAT